ncbi:MAG: tetratricopeptide repeat protein [Candidatus Caldipriscus sp.]|jgi:tetratricopeptide (TPR) repeat protein
MFPFAGFNLFPSLNLITGFFNPKLGAFFQYNTERINTFFYLSSSQRSYAVNFKIYQGLIGLGVDNLDPFLGLGGYLENLWIFSAVSTKGFYLNGNLRYKSFLGGMGFFFGKNSDYYLKLAGGYSVKGFDLGLTFDTLLGTFLGYRWKNLYVFSHLGFSKSPKFELALSLILKPENKKDTVRIEVPIYIQVPVIVRDTVYVRDRRGETVRKESDTLRTPRADPRVVENLYLKGLEAYQKGNYTEALFFFQEVLKLDPRNEKALKAVERIRKILEGR